MTSLLVEAGPGSGKTTTTGFITAYLRATNKPLWLKNHPRLTQEQIDILSWCADNLPNDGTIIGMAYNKDAAKNLDTKTHPSVECRSVHGWGYKIILDSQRRRHVPVSDGVSINQVEKLLSRSFDSLPDKYSWLSATRYLDKLKDELLEPTLTNLLYLSQKYEDLAAFKASEDVAKKIIQLMPVAKTIDHRIGISYMDQVWLACFLIKEPLYDIAIIDECQDISAARRLLCSKIAKHKIWIGDRYQAINAFAGADSKSVEKIQAMVDIVLPLKTSFRNPPNVIRRLNKLKPLANLKGLDKPEGLEERIELEDMPGLVQQLGPKQCMGVCRTNAPLIRVAYRLMESGVACRILGDRVVDQLAKIIKGRKATSLSDFESKLNQYESGIVRNLDEYIAELFKDKINCIRLVLPYASSVEDIVPQLRKLFKPAESQEHIVLSTIHKAKGLEAHNIFILFPPVESPHAKRQEQIEQESNLRYVAESRMSGNTYWVV
jgi:DNA helicase-2/ATP-dependent DNA helicase PcrA